MVKRRTYKFKGDGLGDIWNRVKDFFSGIRKDYPPDFRNFFAKNGERKIVDFVVCRNPVQAVFQNILNLISFGYYEKAKKKLGYDDLFHLFGYMHLDNGEWYRTEKKEVLKIKKVSGVEMEKETRCMSSEPFQPINVKEFFARGQVYLEDTFHKNYFLYDAKDNNCQVFLISLLEGSKISSQKIRNFVLQDAGAIFAGMPKYAHTFTRILTDLGAHFDVLLQGKGGFLNKNLTSNQISEMYRKLLAQTQINTMEDMDMNESSIGKTGTARMEGGAYFGGCETCGGGGCMYCGGGSPSILLHGFYSKNRKKDADDWFVIKSRLMKEQKKGFFRSNEEDKRLDEETNKIFTQSGRKGFGLAKRARKHIYRPLKGKHCPNLSGLRKKELQIIAKQLGLLKKDSKKMRVVDLRAWLKNHCKEYASDGISAPVNYKFKEPKAPRKRKPKSYGEHIKYSLPDYDMYNNLDYEDEQPSPYNDEPVNSPSKRKKLSMDEKVQMMMDAIKSGAPKVGKREYYAHKLNEYMKTHRKPIKHRSSVIEGLPAPKKKKRVKINLGSGYARRRFYS